MRFHLLHCDACGETKNLPISVLYMSQKSGLSSQDKDKMVEAEAGKCKCGGQFSMDATPRCPQCHSDDYEQDYSKGITCYD